MWSLAGQARKPSSTLFPAAPLTLQRKCACGQHAGGGECEECRKQKLSLQRRKGNGSKPASVPPIVRDVLLSSGQPLDADIRAFMEPRFERDFSGVRVHTDARAAESAQAVDALAYTVGRDVVFGEGGYQPETPSGRSLIAHELTHVIQQEHGVVGSPLRVNAFGDPSEQEAERFADAVSRDTSPGRIAHAAGYVQLARSGKSKGGGASAPGTCGGTWTCASPAGCTVPDSPGNGAASNGWKLVVRIDTEAPTASDVSVGTVGHTYVDFQESNGTKYTYGYYPSPSRSPDPVFRPTSPGCIVHPDTAHSTCVDYSETFEITQSQYANALAAAQSFCRMPGTYHLLTANCTTFAAGIAREAGQTLPSARGSVSPARLSADNPNTLIDALRARDAARRGR